MLATLLHIGTILLHLLLDAIGIACLVGMVVAFAGIIVCFCQLAWMGLEPKLFPLPKPGRLPLDEALLAQLSETQLELLDSFVEGTAKRPWPQHRNDPYRELYKAGLLSVESQYGYYGDSRYYKETPEGVAAVAHLREQQDLELAKRPRRRPSAFASAS